LRSLSKRWPNLREHGVGLVELVSAKGCKDVDALPDEAREVHYSFYRTDGGSKEKEREKMDDVEDVFSATASTSTRRPPAVPVPQSTTTTTPTATATAPATSTTTGAVTIHIDQHTLTSKSPMFVLADTVEAYSVPDDEKFELLCRIRAAAVLSNKDKDKDKEDKEKLAIREKLVVVRLLAIAIFGHTHSEAQAMGSLFLYEPDLIAHVAELLQIDHASAACASAENGGNSAGAGNGGVSVTVQTAAIAALDALARYRGKIQEVLTALNAGVNHGVLMSLLRKTITDISSPPPSRSTSPSSLLSTTSFSPPNTFVEALLSFVTFIASHAAGGNMVVSAGLVPLLVQVIGNKVQGRLGVVSKAMQLVDNVLYSFGNAFAVFCAGGGVGVLVGRIEVGPTLFLEYWFRGCADVWCYSMKLTWISKSMVTWLKPGVCLVLVHPLIYFFLHKRLILSIKANYPSHVQQF